jgi:hypothetical protein
MTYEVVQDRNFPGDWRVEAVNHSGDGEVYTAIFTGPDAETRAREYAQWKTTKVSAPELATMER